MRKLLLNQKAFLLLGVAILVVANFCLAPHQAKAHKAIYIKNQEINKTANQRDKTKQQIIVYGNQYGTNKQQINKAQKIVSSTQKEITRKEKAIEDLNQRMKLNKQILKSYIQEILFNSSDNPVIKFTLSNSWLNNFSGNFDQIVNLKEKTLSIMEEIKQDEKDLDKTKKELAQKKKEKQQYLYVKRSQQAQVVSNIRRAKATLTQLNAKLNALRSQLASLLGEGVSMDNVKKATKIASQATGVRKDFILGELVVESNLGRFTGGCYYSKGNHPVGKHMKSADKKIFLNIMDKLGYNKNDKKLSCWPGYGYGGAMGIAQFMPSTWVGYEKTISNATGHSISNPWNVEDGIMGMAIKLANAGASKKSGEHRASKVYYCGSSRSPYWHSKCDDYADNVQYWADNYEEKMN